MSLYDETARALAASTSTTATASSMLDNALGGIGSAVAKELGGGKLAQAVSTVGVGMAKNAAMNAFNRAVPQGRLRNVTTGINIAGSLMNGDVEGAGLQLLDSGLLRDIFPGMDGVASQVKYWGRPTALFGGISPLEAKQLHDKIRATRFARKNLFLLEVSSKLFPRDWKFDHFNLFATDVSYAPITISGEKVRVGSASVDIVDSSEPIEMRISTKDDEAGTIRRWFAAHAATAAGPDGTVGLPAEYAIRIRVVHSIISNERTGGYEDIGLFRPANLEVDLSRRDDNLEEIQMTFSQLDTFMAP